jgi:hypothetical protein
VTTSGEKAVFPLLPTIETVVAFAVAVVVLGALGAADVFALPPPLQAAIAVTQTALAIVRTQNRTHMYSRLPLLKK